MSKTYSYTRVTTRSNGLPSKSPIEELPVYSPIYSSTFRTAVGSSSNSINTAGLDGLRTPMRSSGDDRARSSNNMATFNTTSSYNRTYEKKVIEEGSPNVRVTTQTHTAIPGMPDLGNIHSSMLSNFPNLAISSPSVVGSQNGNLTSIRVTNTSFHAILDVSKYDADSLKVTVVDNNIIVEGSHGEKEDTYGTIESTFKRRFPLPKAVAPESVQSQLTADGHLTIDAKAPEPKQEGARPIQIKVINTSAEQQKQ
ncbi:SHSP domain-containing protein [Caenorhabditis elegans]|uniref:SHSP domain-containing protein n=2 Tax=Caenorhabditis elegans TaxID=6239 RepID=A0A1I6CMC9_CAEEL|nr:SHSP domain-containing protein [Caenorhabditis elegans]SFQ94296.1 SHSP domain-containing protein [Caenorhabditis elegans]|eukprot:NP_001334225.1 Uncharacterized protein CELE_Y55F3BR.6 [Caenorhabditis elegans]